METCSKESDWSLCQTSFGRMSCCKGLNDENYKDDFQSLQSAIDQLPELDVSPEEREQARRVLETLFLWVMSLPDNLRDGMTALEVAEAAWLMDDAIGRDASSRASADEARARRLSGARLRRRRGTAKRLSSIRTRPPLLRITLSALFGPLKKKAKEEIKIQDLKWVESLVLATAGYHKGGTGGSRG